MQKIKIFYIEYKNYIKFFGLNDNTCIIKKTHDNYYKIDKLTHDKRFTFINLLK